MRYFPIKDNAIRFHQTMRDQNKQPIKSTHKTFTISYLITHTSSLYHSNHHSSEHIATPWWSSLPFPLPIISGQTQEAVQFSRRGLLIRFRARQAAIWLEWCVLCNYSSEKLLFCATVRSHISYWRTAVTYASSTIGVIPFRNALSEIAQSMHIHYMLWWRWAK